jgi:transposase
MTPPNLFDPIPTEKFDLLTREELVVLIKGEQSIRVQLQKENDRLRAVNHELKEKHLFLDEQFITIKNKLFGKSSERSEKTKSSKSNQDNKDKKKRVLLPSERYPNAPLIERHITLDQMPECKCCGSVMQDSGMTEESEYLTKVPAQYYVVVQVRHKYACRGCHGSLVTAPVPPRIKEGSSYSDEMMIDVGVSKYCDLIPIERQAQMAAREGLKELPPQSLIESTHYLADFVKPVYDLLKQECLESSVLHADETPHRMLEGDKKNLWFLWGFSTLESSYFECHSTRSGDVASGLLLQSKCLFLVSDVYSGYGKAVGDTNKIRLESNQIPIRQVYCNAHARRYFKQAEEKFPEDAEYFIKQYRRIYRLENLAQKYPDHRLRIRGREGKYFEKIRDKCLSDAGGFSEKSSLGKAMRYFLKNYEGFTRFLSHADLPIDNNPQERLLRNPVIGRKTWYGTHSKLGAKTAAILFSIMQSCRLNDVNPREYLKALVQALHQKEDAFTPAQFKKNLLSQPGSPVN